MGEGLGAEVVFTAEVGGEGEGAAPGSAVEVPDELLFGGGRGGEVEGRGGGGRKGGERGRGGDGSGCHCGGIC